MTSGHVYPLETRGRESIAAMLYDTGEFIDAKDSRPRMHAEQGGVEKPGGLFNTYCLTGWGGGVELPGGFFNRVVVD